MHDEITQELEVRFPDGPEARRAPEADAPPLPAERSLPSRIRLGPSDVAGPLAVFGIGAFLLWMGLTQAIDRPRDGEPSVPEELHELAPRPVAAAPRAPEPATAPDPVVAASPPEAAPVAPSAVEIQLLSGRSPEGAARARDRLVRDHGDLLAGLSPRVERADLGGQGVYFRVRAGPLLGRARAEGICAALSERRQSCIVVD